MESRTIYVLETEHVGWTVQGNAKVSTTVAEDAGDDEKDHTSVDPRWWKEDRNRAVHEYGDHVSERLQDGITRFQQYACKLYPRTWMKVGEGRGINLQRTWRCW